MAIRCLCRLGDRVLLGAALRAEQERAACRTVVARCREWGTKFTGSQTAAGVAPIRPWNDAGAVVARFLQRGWYERGDLVCGVWPVVVLGGVDAA
jgi:hypothetical protein